MINKLVSFLRPEVFLAVAAVSGSFILSSCHKDHDNNGGVNIPVAGLMTFNLSPDQSNVGFAISGNNLTNAPLTYPNYNGNYQRIYTGQRTIDAYDYYTSSGTLASVPGNFDSARYYSVFLIGDSGHYRNVLVNDNFDSLSGTTGQAYIRYINAIPDSVTAPAITVTAGGTNVINDVPSFGTVSPFKAITPGDISIGLTSTAGIDTSRTITLEQRKVYTILLIGVPGSSTTPPGIRYIANGLLDSAHTASTSAVAHATTVQ
jgi:hypothetical protein